MILDKEQQRVIMRPVDYISVKAIFWIEVYQVPPSIIGILRFVGRLRESIKMLQSKIPSLKSILVSRALEDLECYLGRNTMMIPDV